MRRSLVIAARLDMLRSNDAGTTVADRSVRMAGLTFESALIAAILTILLASLSVAVATRPAIAIPLLLLVVMIASASLEPVSVVAGIHVGATEILSVTLVVATLIRLQNGLGWRPSRLLVLLMLVLVLGVVRGLTPFGLQGAVVSAEEMLAMLSAAVFFSTVRITPSLIRTLRNSFLLAFGVLVCAAAVFWSQHGLDTFAATGDRAINAIQALIVLEATVLMVLFPPFRGLVLRFALPLIGAAVVVLSTQRTVWVGGLVAAAVLSVARRKNGGSATAPRLIVAVAAVGVVLLVAAGPATVTRNLETGSQETGTFDWRLEGWSALIHRQLNGSTVDLAVGSPVGTGEDRVLKGQRVTVAAHSEYVSTLDLVGLIGLSLLAWVCGSTLVWSRRRMRATSPFIAQAGLLFVALLALQIVYFFDYSIGALAGLVLGLACAFVRESEGTGRSIVSQRFDSLSTRNAQR
jgi:hypothetical protein